MSRHPSLIAIAAVGIVACVSCVEPIVDPDADRDITARFSTDECTVLYPGPGVDDGKVGICHAWVDEYGACSYEYLRVSPESCREAHAAHDLDFRSDDPLCRILPGGLASREPVLDTVH